MKPTHGSNRRRGAGTHPRWMQITALLVTGTFFWSFLVAPSTLALAAMAQRQTLLETVQPKQRFPGFRLLSPKEMANMWGAASIQPQPVAADGEAYPWQNTVAGVNTANGNKLTSIPIVNWTARGGLSVDFTLYHNSLSTASAELGPKWSHTFDISLSLDSAGNATVTWGDGRSYTFTKNINGTYTPPAGIYETLVANGSPISSYTLTTHDQVAYTFTNPNGIGWVCTAYSDPNGNTVSINRNAQNQVTAVVDPSGRKLSFSYNSNGQLASVTDPLGRVWTFTYSTSSGGGSGGGGSGSGSSGGTFGTNAFHPLATSGSGVLTSITWPTLNNTSYSLQLAYNSTNDITTLTDLRGNKWQFTYNTNDTLASETDPLGNTTSFSYTSTQTTVTDPNGHQSTDTYDSSGRRISHTDATGAVTQYAWDASNNLISVTDPLNHTTSYSYDGNGNVLTITDALNNTTTYTYNTRNRVLTQTLPSGRQVVNTYDATGWNLIQTQQKDSQGHVVSTTTYTYDTYGEVLSKPTATTTLPPMPTTPTATLLK